MLFNDEEILLCATLGAHPVVYATALHQPPGYATALLAASKRDIDGACERTGGDTFDTLRMRVVA